MVGGGDQQQGIKDLAEHWPLVALGLAAAGGLVMIITKVFRLFFWNEERIEKVAEKLLTSEVVKRAMTDVATAVFTQASARENEMRAEIKATLDDLKKRDSERAEAVTRTHARIDEMQQLLLKWMGEMAAGRK